MIYIHQVALFENLRSAISKEEKGIRRTSTAHLFRKTEERYLFSKDCDYETSSRPWGNYPDQKRCRRSSILCDSFMDLLPWRQVLPT